MRKFLFVVLALLLVAACAKPQVTCPDGSTVSKAADCPIVQQAQEQLDDLQEQVDDLPTKIETETTEDETPVVTGPMNAELKELLDKARKITNYQFGWAPTVENNDQMVTIQQRTYYVRGDKALVENILPREYNRDTFAPIVYLDFSKKTTFGWCTNQELGACDREGEQRNAKFSDYDIKMPVDWIDEIPNDATITKGPSFSNRQTRVVEYTEDGKLYQVYIDDFYGMPVRIGIYDEANPEQITGGVEYQDISFNSVTEEQVTAPE